MLSREPDLFVGGPLAHYAEGYEQELRRLGYHDRHVALLSELSMWMERRGLAVEQLGSVHLDTFFAERRQRGCRSLVTTRSVVALVAWWADAGLMLPECVPTPGSVDELVSHYREYLIHQRGLTTGTVGNYERVARLFSSSRAPDVAALAALNAETVNRFVAEFCAHPAKVSSREMVTGLRSFLRFLHVQGLIAAPLAQPIPAYSTQREALPRALSADELTR